MPRLFPLPKPLGGGAIRVFPLSNTVNSPVEVFSYPASCWCENQGYGSLLILLNVPSPSSPMRHRILPVDRKSTRLLFRSELAGGSVLVPSIVLVREPGIRIVVDIVKCEVAIQSHAPQDIAGSRTVLVIDLIDPVLMP